MKIPTERRKTGHKAPSSIKQSNHQHTSTEDQQEKTRTQEKGQEKNLIPYLGRPVFRDCNLALWKHAYSNVY